MDRSTNYDLLFLFLIILISTEKGTYLIPLHQTFPPGAGKFIGRSRKGKKTLRSQIFFRDHSLTQACNKRIPTWKSWFFKFRIACHIFKILPTYSPLLGIYPLYKNKFHIYRIFAISKLNLQTLIEFLIRVLNEKVIP